MATDDSIFVTGILVGFSASLVAGIYYLKWPFRSRPKKEISTRRLSHASLSLLLNTVYPEKMSDSSAYDDYTGETLPRMSGCSLSNALLTYIDHGGDKSVAISKFIDKNLSTHPDVTRFLETAAEKLSISGKKKAD